MAVINNSLVSLISRATLLLLVMGLVVVLTEGQDHYAPPFMVAQQAQICSTQLGNINVCAPFVLPGAANTNPSPECCAALQSVDHGCLCSTLSIAARLPTQCRLPAVSCTAN